MSETDTSEAEEQEFERSPNEEEGSGSSKDDATSSDDSDSEEDVQNATYKSVPFEARLQILRDGVSNAQTIKKTKRILKAAKNPEGKEESRLKFKRANKNRPREQSSKFPVKRLREDIIETASRRVRDPRFDSMAGNFRDDVFKKRYGFLYQEQLPDERKQLQKQMKKTKSSERKKELKGSLLRIQQQIRKEQDRLKSEEVVRQHKAKEKEAVKAGKKPYFLKNSDKKRQELIRKFEDLKARGGVQKFIAKRRKRNATKDHSRIPDPR